MAWRDQLFEASFRGVPFETDSVENTSGRRVALHEFPLRDEPQIEDLGRVARGFSLQAYVIGPDYMQGRDALIQALDQPGPGRLVHPYLGEIDVQVEGRYDWSESTREGGLARFRISFLRASSVVYPTVEIDTAALAAAAADALGDVATIGFSNDFSVAGQPEFVLEDAAQIARTAAAAVQAAVSTLTTLPGPLTAVADAVAAFSGAAASLVLSPADLAEQARALLRSLQLSTQRPRQALDALRLLTGFGQDRAVVPGSTPSRQRQAQNQVALINLVQQLAAAEAVRSASQAEYSSYDDALAVRTDLGDRLDGLLESCTRDDTYQALAALRAQMSRDVSARGERLPRLLRVRLAQAQPALVLAYARYADATRADELVARNRARDPLFLPSGVDLEALDA